MMPPQIPVLEQLETAYDLVAEVLRRAPQLHEVRLDQALLVLSLSIQRARRSPRLRYPPQWRQSELDF
jgi:hypothetical protein